MPLNFFLLFLLKRGTQIPYYGLYFRMMFLSDQTAKIIRNLFAYVKYILYINFRKIDK